jgi:hypothetical protein
MPIFIGYLFLTLNDKSINLFSIKKHKIIDYLISFLLFLAAALAYRYKEQLRGWKSLARIFITPMSVAGIYGFIGMPAFIVVNGTYSWGNAIRGNNDNRYGNCCCCFNYKSRVTA